MDLLYLPSVVPAIASFLAAFMFLCFLIKWKSPRDSRRTPPEAGGAWPIVGHLHRLAGSHAPHRTLGDMADKYGPIFAIKLGVHRALVVSGWEIAKEFLSTNDKVFANRPKVIASEILGYNYAMFGLGPYGPYWRQVRKIATLELLSNHRLQTLSHVRQSEVKTAIKEIYELCVKNSRAEMDMKKWFENVTLNVIFRMVVGKRYLEATSSSSTEVSNGNNGEDYRCRKAVRDFFELMGVFVVSDAIPYLRWLDLGGYERAMNKTSKELDQLAQRWLDEHKQRKKVSGEVDGDQDFMDVMLSTLEGAELGFSSYDADTIIKATSLALILAGTDTTTVTMTWALALLLNNRDALQKAHQELDQHVGRERRVKESDLKNLVYLQAILKETMRLYPAAPLAFPHESTEDCTVGGYHVLAGTRVLFNLPKLQSDPKVWDEPSKFRPERFLTTHQNVDVRGQNFELIPFGSGRRMCPGVSFALQVTQLTLASLLHGFQIATTSDEPIDMRETVGLTNLIASPLDVLFTPRLPAEAYL